MKINNIKKNKITMRDHVNCDSIEISNKNIIPN